ncbi:MAG TPA: hypothetical protein PLN06_06170 [Bacteroidales bacterium]|nr:hypothetical protein [Bacteroidales bacterium]HOU96198.1 hypothetical protein [Bacteroidales bacterium]HQG36050.1 hypothetical protein [Bacteroidales bacterium]HQG52812.1 hypothetical protein [Bacteroidales bacterium]
MTLLRSDIDVPKVVPLFETDNPISFFGLNNVVNAILNNIRFEQLLKEYMEAVIYSEYLKLLSGSVIKVDDPFDSIYIADLSPDKINTETIKRIVSIGKKIEDHSEQILFNDGLDD